VRRRPRTLSSMASGERYGRTRASCGIKNVCSSAYWPESTAWPILVTNDDRRASQRNDIAGFEFRAKPPAAVDCRL
jgi:hypothetical protein